MVDVLSEERDGGEKKERSGEEGRFARLVTSLLDTLQINLEGFNGKSIVFCSSEFELKSETREIFKTRIFKWTVSLDSIGVLKVPKHEIFDGVFFAYIRPN